MKIRILAVILMGTLVAWLPLAAQQPASVPPSPQAAPASPDAAKTAPTPSCGCCAHEKSQAGSPAAKTEKQDHPSMAGCNEKPSSDMSCCNEKHNDGKASMLCCKNHDAKLCAAKGGRKSCCDWKDGKSCCGRDATACSSNDGKECCAAVIGVCSNNAA